MKTKLCFLSCLFPILLASSIAQTGSGKTPEASTDVGKSTKWNDIQKQARSGDYLLGKVVFAGLPAGSLPWDPVPVHVTCEGKIRYTADADPKGNFEIAAVDTNPHKPLGTDGSKPASEFVGCAVEAALAGFNSTVLNIVNRNILDNPDIGTITLSREEGAAGGAVSSTTASAPKDAAKAFEKARAEWLEQKPEKAQRDLERRCRFIRNSRKPGTSWERSRKHRTRRTRRTHSPRQPRRTRSSFFLTGTWLRTRRRQENGRRLRMTRLTS